MRILHSHFKITRMLFMTIHVTNRVAAKKPRVKNLPVLSPTDWRGAKIATRFTPIVAIREGIIGRY